MQPTSIQSSPVRDGRRVLAEKTANACLTPAHLRKASAAAKGDIPVKGPLFGAPSPTKKLLPSPALAGHKRTIEHLEDCVRPSWPSGDRRPHAEPALEKLMERSDTQSTRRDDDQVDDLSTHNATDQEDGIPTSKSDAYRAGANNSTPMLEDAERRKSFIQTKANLLRDRIQNAMRHVKDLQLDRRLSDLEAHCRKVPRLSFPPAAIVSSRDTSTDIVPSPLPNAHSHTPLPTADLTAASPQLTVRPESGSAFHTTRTSVARVGPSGDSTPLRVEARPAAASNLPTGSPVRPGTPRCPPPVEITRCRLEDVLDNAGDECVVTGRNSHKQPNREDVVMGNLLPPSHRSDAVDGLLRLRKTADEGGDSVGVRND